MITDVKYVFITFLPELLIRNRFVATFLPEAITRNTFLVTFRPEVITKINLWQLFVRSR